MSLGKSLQRFFGDAQESRSSTNVNIPDWLAESAKPLYTRSAETAMRIADQPYQRYTGARVAGIDPKQRRALSNIYQSPYSDAYTNEGENFRSAKGYTGDVLSGKYMKGNPYLEDIIGQTKRGITESFEKSALPQMQANLSRQGAFGGSGWVEQNQNLYDILAKNLADAESNLRFSNYGTERGYLDKAAEEAMSQEGFGIERQQARDAALQRALAAGELPRGLIQERLDVRKSDFDEKRDWLFRALNALGGGIGNIEGLYGKSTRSKTQELPSKASVVADLGKMFL